MSLMNYEPVSGFGEKGKKLEKLVISLVVIILVTVIGSK